MASSTSSKAACQKIQTEPNCGTAACYYNSCRHVVVSEVLIGQAEEKQRCGEPSVVVMPRESGASSTPRRFDWNAEFSGMLDHPLSRMMTVLMGGQGGASLPHQLQPFVLGQHGDAVLLGFRK